MATANTRPLRVGIISAAWGVHAHLPAWRSLDGIEVTAICTSRPETAKAACDATGVPRAFHDFHTLAADPDAIARFRQKNARRLKGVDAPNACIEAVEAAASLPFEVVSPQVDERALEAKLGAAEPADQRRQRERHAAFVKKALGDAAIWNLGATPAN